VVIFFTAVVLVTSGFLTFTNLFDDLTFCLVIVFLMPGSFSVKGFFGALAFPFALVSDAQMHDEMRFSALNVGGHYTVCAGRQIEDASLGRTSFAGDCIEDEELANEGEVLKKDQTIPGVKDDDFTAIPAIIGGVTFQLTSVELQGEEGLQVHLWEAYPQ
jgi:hypothetical protein